MRLCLLLLCACSRAPIADPGTAVRAVAVAAPGMLVVTGCSEPLRGDSNRPSPLYLVDKGAVSRWLPPGLADGVMLWRSSPVTAALYFEQAEALSALWPDGHIGVVDAHPGRTTVVAGDGRHRMVLDGQTAEWRTLDGKLERRLQLPDFTDRIFPAPNGEAVLVEVGERPTLVQAASVRPLLEHARLLAAAWASDGRRLAMVTTALTGGALAADDATTLWVADLDGAMRRLELPPRPREGLIARWLGLPHKATSVSAVVWSGERLLILSSHESECWSGGRDIPGGCERGLYRLAPDGTGLERISPRAFRCESLYLLR